MEEILEPDLIICDPHHHLWDETYGNFGYRYMAEELLAGTGSRRHIEKTVFVQCRSGYRIDGPEQFRCVGEPCRRGDLSICDTRGCDRPSRLTRASCRAISANRQRST